MKEADVSAVEKKYLRPSSASGYENMKLRSPARRGDIENTRPVNVANKEYSVSNIDRIQQRIQSILGRKWWTYFFNNLIISYLTVMDFQQMEKNLATMIRQIDCSLVSEPDRQPSDDPVDPFHKKIF